MVPLHSAGDVGLGTGLSVSSYLDPRLTKPKQGSAVACLPAFSGLLVWFSVPVRCAMGDEGVLQRGDEHHRCCPKLRDGSCLLQPAVVLIIQVNRPGIAG